ncbi:hypothetical protein BSKO_07587 [Bryopsis sp. KO-2023]|nr:hypothetical protein BSKO_07587 [Bryopsis sp. KO-2023]
MADEGRAPPQQDDYVPNNVLVTGGAGFIGSHVTTRLVNNYPQYKVVVLDKLEYCATLNNLRSCQDKPNFKFIKGDIKSADLMRHVFQSEKIDTILHFAAQSHCDHLFGNSLDFTLNDTFGTHVLLESARAYGKIERFINVSTDDVYGQAEPSSSTGLMDDSTTLEPTNPYSAAKAAVEMLVKAFINSYDLPCITTRANNVFGPHQYPEKLIPKMTLLGLKGLDLSVHGDGENTRTYLYVEDVAEAYDLVLHKGVLGETYNIGTKRERSVNEVVRAIANYFKMPDEKIVHVDDRAFNDRRYVMCVEKLEGLGWKEKTSWEEGLSKTIEWYVKNNVTEYFEHGNMTAALEPHPTVCQ